MSLLQFIVSELDRELRHLQSLRKIVAGLAHTPAILRKVAEVAAVPATTPVPEPQRGRRPRSDAGQRRGRRAARPVQPGSALARAVPVGPVVFNPAQLREEQARREQNQATQQEAEPLPQTQEDLEALGRDLAARWATGT